MARIAVDIDGVIAEKLDNGNYPEDYKHKKVIEGAVEALKYFKALGHYIILFTARCWHDQDVTIEWLRKNGFEGLYDEIIFNKPYFHVLIDDRALRFTNWAEVKEKVTEMTRSGEWF